MATYILGVPGSQLVHSNIYTRSTRESARSTREPTSIYTYIFHFKTLSMLYGLSGLESCAAMFDNGLTCFVKKN